MAKGEYAILLARSTGHAYQIERVLKKTGIGCKLIPVPRHLGSDCGLCVKVDVGSLAQAITALKDSGVAAESVHEI
jgi:hypothetical protein